MGLMEAMQDNGLDVDLLSRIEEHLIPKNRVKDVSDTLINLVSKHGLTGKPILKKLAEYQKTNVLKPGVYKHFREIDSQVKDLQAQQLNEVGSQDPSAAESPIIEEFIEPPVTEQPSSDNFEFSETQEQKLKDLLKQEEERFKAKLLEKERRWREKIAKGEDVKAKKLGMTSEQAAKVREIKAKLTTNNATIKELREENVQLKIELNEVRPKRSRKPLTPEQKSRMADARRKYWADRKAGKA